MGSKRMYLSVAEDASSTHKKLIEGHNQGKWTLYLNPRDINYIWGAFIRGGTSRIKYFVPSQGKVWWRRNLSLCIQVRNPISDEDNILTRVMMAKYKERQFLQNCAPSAESFMAGLAQLYLEVMVLHPVARMLAITSILCIACALGLILVKPDFEQIDRQISAPTKPGLYRSRIVSPEYLKVTRENYIRRKAAALKKK